MGVMGGGLVWWGMGEWFEIVFLPVWVPIVLVCFLFAICIDISMEDRGDFSGDSVLSFISSECFLY